MNLDSVAHNVRLIREVVAPSAVWAVVKADAYGHGAVPVARAALGAGAEGLCVALVSEGVELRAAGLTAPILILSQSPVEELDLVVSHQLTPTVYCLESIEALAQAATRAGQAEYPVHLKVDTGMHRVGAAPEHAVELANAIAAHPQLELQGVFTHLAVADEPDAPSNSRQLALFDSVVDKLVASGHEPALIHVANSAGALGIAESHRGLVRLGIAMYGAEPGPGVAALCADLRPALSLRAKVSFVKRVAAGEGISYGLRHVFADATTVATVPLGYADGVPRRLFDVGGEVLIGGVRRPIVGVVTMDQLMVDCGNDVVSVGDEVVLIGSQTHGSRADEIRAEEWAARLGTIAYEILCGISQRIERHYP
ncbi:MAG: alanine racemase [Actinomycetota bacterium]